MGKRWVEHTLDNHSAIVALQQSLQIDKILATLLVQRGVTTFEEARSFFRPELGHLHDPFLMKDMNQAIVRIEEAIAANEKILIYGDYDVDGTTSVALVYRFLKKIYLDVDFYIPNRYTEGYGISTQGIDYAEENYFSLIIALDCGIKSVDKIAYANEKGIDFIICDHHLPGDELPDAIRDLDPKRTDCPYPYKELSGCGIGFKLIHAFAIRNQIHLDNIYCYLDLVAVSIASDIVPITGENRVLAWHGLEHLNTNPCKGLAALKDIAGRKNNYTITDVVFQIGPRINAAGRIDDAKHAVNLLISDTYDDAIEKSKIINLKNSERKEYDADITDQALAMLDHPDYKTRKTTVVFNENWHKGVIGIVASRLTETYYRPTVVLTKSNDLVAGSARSVIDFDLYEALFACGDLLEQFGGHKYAAGLTMKAENIPLFQQRFEEVVSASITDDLLTQRILIDAEINLDQIHAKFIRILNQLAPFGPQNMAPVFMTKQVYAYGTATLVGNNHLKMSIKQPNSPIFVSCIGFGLGEYLPAINQGIPFDICYCIEENIFREQRSLQLNIKGIKPLLLEQKQNDIKS